MKIRKELLITLGSHFILDLKEATRPITGFDDNLYMAEKLKEFTIGVFNAVPPNEYFETRLFDEDDFIRKHLLARFRDKMKPFMELRLDYYLTKNEFRLKILFERLNIREPIFNIEEYEYWANNLLVHFDRLIDHLYLTPPDSQLHQPDQLQLTDANKSSKELREKAAAEKGYTRNRQTLIYYYQMLCLGYKANSNRAKLAEFAHHLFAEPLDKIENSGIYKRFKLAPDKLSGPEKSLTDLQYVYNLFDSIKLLPALDLIRKDIALAEEELNRERKNTRH